MTTEEKQAREAEAREKIKALAAWFEGRELPRAAFRLNAWTFVENCRKYVDSLTGRMEGGDVRSKDLQAAYLHLTELKTFLENKNHNQ